MGGLVITQAVCLVTQEPMAPARLSIANIALYTFTQGQVLTPALQQPGSTPKTWSVTPPLPSFLSLDTATEKISQVTPKPPVTPTTTHTLSVSNGVPGSSPATATFTVTVSLHR